MLGHPIINDNYEISVWQDASVVFYNSIREFVEKYFDIEKAPFSAFPHSLRNCIYEEAKECIKLRKDSKENINKTINFLKKERYPKNNGLYEMTVFIKSNKDKKVKETMELWFDMVCNYSKRDQLSFMYCVYKTGMKINDIEKSVWENDYFYWIKHNAVENIDSYRIYFGDEEKYDEKNDIHGEYKIYDSKYIIELKVPTQVDKVKIELSKVPCVKYKNLKIRNVKKSEIQVINTIDYHNEQIFYNDTSYIIINKKFKKDSKFYLEVEFEKLTKDEIYNLLDYIKYQSELMFYKNNEIVEEINELSTELYNIKNSFIVKLYFKLKNFFHIKNENN